MINVWFWMSRYSNSSLDNNDAPAPNHFDTNIFYKSLVPKKYQCIQVKKRAFSKTYFLSLNFWQLTVFPFGVSTIQRQYHILYIYIHIFLFSLTLCSHTFACISRRGTLFSLVYSRDKGAKRTRKFRPVRNAGKACRYVASVDRVGVASGMAERGPERKPAVTAWKRVSAEWDRWAVKSGGLVGKDGAHASRFVKLSFEVH